MGTIHHFDRSALPVPRIFYEQELGKLTRPSRGWARGNCPFHESKSRTSFSVNLDSGGFYCFGCDAKGGDAVAFLRLRYKLDFKSACVQLGAWRENITPQERRDLEHRRIEQEQHRAEEAARRQSERRERIAERNHLHALEKLYREAIKAHDWEVMSRVLPLIRIAEADYWRLAGFGVVHEPRRRASGF